MTQHEEFILNLKRQLAEAEDNDFLKLGDDIAKIVEKSRDIVTNNLLNYRNYIFLGTLHLPQSLYFNKITIDTFRDEYMYEVFLESSQFQTEKNKNIFKVYLKSILFEMLPENKESNQ